MKRCPSCGRRIAPRFVLCGPCWSTLPPEARHALNVRDSRTESRQEQLLEQLGAGVALHDIEITEQP